MLKNQLDGKTYNDQIAAASNYIGQKLFAYISHGKNINDRIRTKFSKSLIFIGDEGQIYQPLTNTYIGIGQTAYTHAITYIEEAHEKIDALNKMLTSSMVTSIYANWGKDTWDKLTNSPDKQYRPGVTQYTDEGSFESLLPSKVFATNDIILRGIGDYDPVTKLAYTREVAHITDENAYIDPEDPNAEQYKLAKAQRTALEGSYIVNTSSNAFATSGITVSLEKGLNRYMFTYTFTTPDLIPGANNRVWTKDCEKVVKEKNLNWTKTITLYFTNDEFKSFMESTDNYTVPDYYFPTEIETDNGNPVPLKISRSEVTREEAGQAPDVITSPLAAFKLGITPVYDDGYGPERFDGQWIYTNFSKYKDAIVDKYIIDYTTKSISNLKTNWFTSDSLVDGTNYWYQDRYYQAHQLFKQGKNTLTIDDKLTWSYISSAYSYTLDFSKKYTDAQVERIYKELLGESNTALIPVGFEQLAVQEINPDATRDIDYINMSWNEDTGKWDSKILDRLETASEDGTFSHSAYLTQYRLNRGSLYVQKLDFTNDTVNPLRSLERTEIDGKTYYPWFVLSRLAKHVEDYMRAYKDAYEAHPSNEGANLKEGDKITPVTDNDTKKFGDFIFTTDYKTCIDAAIASFDLSWTFTDYDGNNHDYVCKITADNIDNVCFMGYERDTDYSVVTVTTKNTEDGNSESHQIDNSEIADGWKYGNYNRPEDSTEAEIKNDLSKHDEDGSDPGDGKWGLPAHNQWGDEITDHGYTISKDYSLNVVYSIIDELKDLGSLTETHKSLYVVNTAWTNVTDINLADGIQTLKEVAYVLDMITDGWGNHYNDAEGNGILLTYTIANNHDRIVDHERRLKDIESGTNVVKGIGKLDYLTSDFVNLTLTSDVLWQFKYMEESDADKERKMWHTQSSDGNLAKYDSETTTTDIQPIDWTLYSALKDIKNFGLDETKDWLGFSLLEGVYNYDAIAEPNKEHNPNHLGGNLDFKTTATDNSYNITIHRIPTSYIIAYNTKMRHYIINQQWIAANPSSNGTTYGEGWNGEEVSRPTWDEWQLTGVGILEVTDDYTRELNDAGVNSTYVFATPDQRYLAIHSYVGHVGIGIDLKLAQTYTTVTNSHNDMGGNVGFVCVDPYSSILKKKVNIYAYLPANIDTDNKITWFGDDYKVNDINNYNKRYDKTAFDNLDTEEKINLLNNANVSSVENYDDNTIDHTTDKGLLTERLEELGLTIADVNNITIEVEESNSDRARFTFEFIIDPNDAIVTSEASNYTGKLYTSNSDFVYNGTNVTNGVYSIDDVVLNIDNTTNTATFTPSTFIEATNFVFDPNNAPDLFVRYKDYNNTVLSVDLDYDGLTTTKWVTTYVSNVTNDFDKSLKELEVKSIKNAEKLINALDNNFIAQRDKMVIGVSQQNGIVTPILADIPKDELTSSVSVWGENKNVTDRREYVAVTSFDITNELLTSNYTPDTEDGVEATMTFNKDYPLYIRKNGLVTYVLIEEYNESTIDWNNLISMKKLVETDASYIAIKAKYDIVSDILYTVNQNDEFVEITNDITDAQIRSSLAVGPDYDLYVPIYLACQGYERIDGAQLRKDNAGDWVYTIDGTESYKTSNTLEDSQIFTTVEATEPKAERKYISTSYIQHKAEEAGNGGTSMHVTAHITKLADATEKNSGLVDAYDVRETLDNMFEWVDLSLWDDDNAPKSNPINTLANEEGGFRDDNWNISNANAAGYDIYPRPYYSDEEATAKNVILPERRNKWTAPTE